jgi:hypothetical protein
MKGVVSILAELEWHLRRQKRMPKHVTEVEQ